MFCLVPPSDKEKERAQKLPENGSRTALEGPPNGHREPPRPRHGPKEAQDDPKTGPEVAKTRPRQAQEGPKSAQEGPKRGQDELQRPSQRASKGDLAGRDAQMRKSAFRFDGSRISGGAARRVSGPKRGQNQASRRENRSGRRISSRSGPTWGPTARNPAQDGRRPPGRGSETTANRIGLEVKIHPSGQTCVRSS